MSATSKRNKQTNTQFNTTIVCPGILVSQFSKYFDLRVNSCQFQCLCPCHLHSPFDFACVLSSQCIVMIMVYLKPKSRVGRTSSGAPWEGARLRQKYFCPSQPRTMRASVNLHLLCDECTCTHICITQCTNTNTQYTHVYYTKRKYKYACLWQIEYFNGALGAST